MQNILYENKIKTITTTTTKNIYTIYSMERRKVQRCLLKNSIKHSVATTIEYENIYLLVLGIKHFDTDTHTENSSF